LVSNKIELFINLKFSTFFKLIEGSDPLIFPGNIRGAGAGYFPAARGKPVKKLTLFKKNK